MSWLIYAGIGLFVWNLIKGKAVVAPTAPAIESHPELVSEKDRSTRGFNCLLELRDVLRQNGVTEEQVRAIVEPIAPLLISKERGNG